MHYTSSLTGSGPGIMLKLKKIEHVWSGGSVLSLVIVLSMVNDSFTAIIKEGSQSCFLI